MKFRRDRRPELPRESVWWFYPKYWYETAVKQYRWIALYRGLRKIYLRIKHDPARAQYTDLALTPVFDDDIESHELFNTEAARAYVSQERRLEKIRHGGGNNAPLVPAALDIVDVASAEVPIVADTPGVSVH